MIGLVETPDRKMSVRAASSSSESASSLKTIGRGLEHQRALLDDLTLLTELDGPPAEAPAVALATPGFSDLLRSFAIRHADRT